MFIGGGLQRHTNILLGMFGNGANNPYHTAVCTWVKLYTATLGGNGTTSYSSWVLGGLLLEGPVWVQHRPGGTPCDPVCEDRLQERPRRRRGTGNSPAVRCKATRIFSTGSLCDDTSLYHLRSPTIHCHNEYGGRGRDGDESREGDSIGQVPGIEAAADPDSVAHLLHPRC